VGEKRCFLKTLPRSTDTQWNACRNLAGAGLRAHERPRAAELSVGATVSRRDDATRGSAERAPANDVSLFPADPAAPSRRRRSKPSEHAVKAIGAALILCTAIIIVIAPYVMSIAAATGLELFLVFLGAAYGIYLAAHSRSTHVGLERAYSAHLEELSQRLRNMAYRDALTGLFNHRYFYEQLAHEVDRAVRYGQPLALLLMDMDNFKEINDTCGHLAGDKFLGFVGQVIAGQIRASDIGARYGGDEFVVILPNTGVDEARLTADKLMAAVAASGSMGAVDERVKLGISIGYATCPDDSRTAGELLQVADNRLYEQKAARGLKRRRGRADVA
jgi:diguanylate cyclase (GGDEF)-like protein